MQGIIAYGVSSWSCSLFQVSSIEARDVAIIEAKIAKYQEGNVEQIMNARARKVQSPTSLYDQSMLIIPRPIQCPPSLHSPPPNDTFNLTLPLTVLAWVDIWSFGITALESAHGHDPFPS
ncbi:hypothetical protein Scep_029575 [Stephania cephalantha]|uniref:Protein kinase domain-containing protein n=1 Tax=Stephania cephalantha TaxID=152367 RepID=A0AAP0DXX9_9MAGN